MVVRSCVEMLLFFFLLGASFHFWRSFYIMMYSLNVFYSFEDVILTSGKHFSRYSIKREVEGTRLLNLFPKFCFRPIISLLLEYSMILQARIWRSIAKLDQRRSLNGNSEIQGKYFEKISFFFIRYKKEDHSFIYLYFKLYR